MKKLSPMTRKELAKELGISYTTLYRRLKYKKEELGISNNRLLMPEEVLRIYRFLNAPIPEQYLQSKKPG